MAFLQFWHVPKKIFARKLIFLIQICSPTSGLSARTKIINFGSPGAKCRQNEKCQNRFLPKISKFFVWADSGFYPILQKYLKVREYPFHSYNHFCFEVKIQSYPKIMKIYMHMCFFCGVLFCN